MPGLLLTAIAEDEIKTRFEDLLKLGWPLAALLASETPLGVLPVPTAVSVRRLGL